MLLKKKWSFRGCQYGTFLFLKWPMKDPANNGERKHRNDHNRVCCTAETADQKEHRLSKPMQDKDRAGMLLVQLPSSHASMNGLWPHETTAEAPEHREFRLWQISTHATYICSTYPSYLSAIAIINQIVAFRATAYSGSPCNTTHSSGVNIALSKNLVLLLLGVGLVISLI